MLVLEAKGHFSMSPRRASMGRTQRRVTPRYKISIKGKILIKNEPSLVFNCNIVDVSLGGAKIELEEFYKMPKIILLFELHAHNIYECAVRWQKFIDVGIKFVDIYSKSERAKLIEDCSLGLIEPDLVLADAREASKTTSRDEE